MSKQLTVAGALAALVTAQWNDLPSFTDANDNGLIDQLENNNKNNCFQVSQIKGRTDFTTNFASDLSTLKE